MRVHVCAVRMTLHRADVLEAYLNGQDNIQKATVYERTGDVVLTYQGSRRMPPPCWKAFSMMNPMPASCAPA